MEPPVPDPVRDAARKRCMQLTRAVHHLLDAQSRLTDAGLQQAASRVGQILTEIQPIREKAWAESGGDR